MDPDQFQQLLAALGAINDTLNAILGGLGFGFGSIFFFLVLWLGFIWRGR